MVKRVKSAGKIATPAPAVGAAQLTGAWRLLSWEIRYADGRVTRPFGRRPQGLLLYTPDGGMSASVAARDRRAFPAANPREAPLDDRARAFDSCFFYAGRYSVRGTTVRHDVTVSMNPAMVGTRQVREVRLTRGRLELSAAEGVGKAGERRHSLVWARIRAGDAGRTRRSSREATP